MPNTHAPTTERVLIVDDDLASRQLLRLWLEADGYAVEEAVDGDEALTKYTHHRPDLVLVDALMPGLDGFDVCMRLQALPRETRAPVIMITALNDETSIDRAFDAGAADYVTKPIHWPVVRQRIRRLLRAERAEKELEARHQLLRILIDHIPDYIYIKDSQGRFVINNRAHARLMGADTPEEVVGKTDREMFPPELSIKYADDEQRVLQASTPLINAEELIVDPGGQARWVLTTKVPLRDSAGQVIGLVGISHDITERKQVEAVLAEERTLLHTLIDTVPDLIFVKDDQSRFRINNAAHLAVLGAATQAEVAGKTDFDYFPRDQAERFFADEQTVMQTGQALLNREELATDHASGRLTWLDTTKAPLRDPSGKVIGLVGISHDVTALKHAQAALAEERNRLRTLIDHLPDSIFVKDNQGRFLLSNPTQLARLGAANEADAIGKTDFDYYPPDQAASFWADDQAVLQAGAALINREEQVIDQTSGRLRWFDTTKAALRDHRGQITGLVGISRDITARKQADLALRRRDALLEGLADIARLFLRSTDLDRSLPEALARLGQAADASRVQLYENQVQPDGTFQGIRRYAWTAPHLRSLSATPDGQPLPYPQMEAWYHTLSTNSMIAGVTRDFLPPVRAILQQAATLSIAIVSVFCGETFWGVLTFADCQTEREWLPVETEAMRYAASSLGMALLRQRAEAAEHEQRVLAEALRAAATAINSSLHLDEVLERILASLDRVVPYDAADIMLIDQGLARVMRARGYTERGLEPQALAAMLPVDDTSTLRQAVQSGQVQIIPDVRTAPDWVPTAASGWIRSYMVAPISVDGQVIGFLNLNSAEPNQFTLQDAGWLRAFTDQAAIAIHNAQLFAAEQEQRALAEALRDSASALISTHDPDVVMARILEDVGRVVPHDRANILLIEGDLARVAYWRNYPAWYDAAFRTFRLPVTTPNLQVMIATQSPQVVADTCAYPGWVTTPETAEIRSYAAAPMRIAGRVIGFLDLDSGQPGFFTQAHAERLQAFADQAALAIENAQLYAALQQDADDLQQRVEQRTVELSRMKDHLQAILDNSSDAILVVRDDGVIQQVNPAFCALLGYRPEEVAGHAWQTFVDPDLALTLDEALRSVATGPQPARIELDVRRQDGARVSVDVGVSLVKRPRTAALSTEPVEVVCSVRDITARKQVEAELRRAFAQEKELGDLRSRFVSMASHDFRTPLAVILSSSDLLRMQVKRLQPEILDILDPLFTRIGTAVQQMTKLLDDILTYGQVDAGKLDLAPEGLDLVPFCQDILQEIQLASSPPPDLTFVLTGQPAHLMTDRQRLRQILVNLLANAVKYSPPGGPVQLHVKAAPDAVVFQVRDAGIGIPSPDQAHLFELFYRATNVGKVQGTGLGLAIVKRAVDSLGGRISVESRVGVGTTFTVALPATDRHAGPGTTGSWPVIERD